MVARRSRRRTFATEAEAAKAAFAAVPVSDEDPADFWGPDWKEKLEEARADVDAGRGDYFDNLDDFLAALEAESQPCPPSSVLRDSSGTTNGSPPSRKRRSTPR